MTSSEDSKAERHFSREEQHFNDNMVDLRP